MVFLMANMIREGVAHHLPSDLLFYMRAKVSRRLHKLRPTASLLVQQICEVNKMVEHLLQSRWLLVQAEQASSTIWGPLRLDILGDTRLSLHNSRAHLEKTIRGAWTGTVASMFYPRERPRPADRHNGYGQTLHALTKAVEDHSYIALADLESWVQRNLEDWVHTDVLSDCNVISACITTYYASANRMYDSNPEDQSIMLLTLFELWVALDRLTVANCPLLLDYLPEVTPTLLEPLLLRQSKSFDRVARIRQYLRERHNRAIYGSIFTDTVNSETFAVRYFDRSLELRTLKESIEAAAHRSARRRRKNFKRSAKYRELKALADRWAADSFADCNVSSRCTMQLPLGPYSSLQYAVTSTSHTSNEVLAKQSECPADISLHEYITFGGIRAGSRIQWLNISREIAAQTLNLNREEVYLLLTQAAWQIGPQSDGENWDYHEELSSPDFSIALLQVLGKLINDIEANWSERISAKTAIALIGRLLASATNQNVIDQAYILLRKARHMTLRWMHQLAEILQENEDESAVEPSTCVFAKWPPYVAGLMTLILFMHHSFWNPWRMFLFLSDVQLLFMRICLQIWMPNHWSERIRENRDGLDAAIGNVWRGYRPGPPWKQLKEPNDRWWSTATSTGAGESQDVHSMASRLALATHHFPTSDVPAESWERYLDPYYRVAIKVNEWLQKILDIIPSDMPNMEYATRNLIFGHLVGGLPNLVSAAVLSRMPQMHFSLRDGENFILRTTSEADNGPTLELLPHHIFTGDLPTSLTNHMVHWIDVSTRQVELRPLNNPWLYSKKNWCMCLPESGPWTMEDSSQRLLVDIRSPTFEMVLDSLSCLESRNNLVVTTGEPLGLWVELPRFRLSFVLRNGLLHSRNFPGMVVDEDQSSGTMFGLHSQLLARSRRVIIPQGEVNFSSFGNHVSATISTARLTRVLYHDYEIDTNLGRLVGNAEVEVLRKISALTPVRTWYPPHRRVMQEVKWSELAPSAQHDGFRTVVQSIIDHAERLQMFYHSRDNVAIEFPSDTHLLARAARRSASLYSPEFAGGANSHYQDNVDVVYVSRDVATNQGMQSEAVIRGFPTWPISSPHGWMFLAKSSRTTVLGIS
ncbi:hypothetical protein BS47DRAFT_1369498 [Hydnum rufescens UP504]|uniref:Uncharacterized protein n=1 Tax=Hydnum rufescens UP504 TaxID=1448309 RepID=A0A9P6AD23_9AGAM|nr:hypothetical protein BS47DRAFT_1369498 [Hydnum rufescens UP504]